MKALSTAARATALAAALFATALPVSAAMGQAALTLSTPQAGATLASGPVDMSVYYTRTEGKGFDVVATYVTESAPDQPRQLIMTLSDGDRVQFSLPGQLDTLYSFSRQGDAVTVSSQPVALSQTGA